MALDQSDYARLPEILHRHEAAMAAIAQAGECRDTALLPLIIDIRDEVATFTRELTEKSAAVTEQLRVNANKQKLAKAYGR